MCDHTCCKNVILSSFSLMIQGCAKSGSKLSYSIYSFWLIKNESFGWCWHKRGISSRQRRLRNTSNPILLSTRKFSTLSQKKNNLHVLIQRTFTRQLSLHICSHYVFPLRGKTFWYPELLNLSDTLLTRLSCRYSPRANYLDDRCLDEKIGICLKKNKPATKIRHLWTCNTHHFGLWIATFTSH